MTWEPLFASESTSMRVVSLEEEKRAEMRVELAAGSEVCVMTGQHHHHSCAKRRKKTAALTSEHGE